MSRIDYYNASRAEILKRLKSIQEENIVDFFEESDSFSLAIYLAYFALAEEVLIERDSHNPDINTRFKRHIDAARLDELFRNPELIKIYEKEVNGNSREWFISTLRNGIIHKGPEVDYHNQNVNVYNDGELNKLNCDVSFDWFRNFILDDLLLHSTIGEYNYTSFISPYRDPRYVSSIDNFDDIRNFIDNDLLAYTIKIKHNSGDEIHRDEFLRYCHDKEVNFWGYLFNYNDLDEDRKKELRTYEMLVTNALGTPQGITPEEYRRLFNYTFYTAWFETDFKRKYPGYSVDVSEFNRLNPSYSMVVNGLSRNEVEKRMFGSYRKTQNFFNNLHPAIQRMEIATCLSRLINSDKVDYISHMQYLFSIYDMHKGCGKNDYGIDKFIKQINSYRRNNLKIEQDYATEIHNRLSANGVVHSYDRQITEMIIACCNSKDEDVYRRCRELCSKFDDPKKDEYFKYICDVLKSEFPEFYQDESDKRKECGIYSDQVQEIFSEKDLYRLCNAMYVFKEERDDILVALLYALGINTYVVNKEMTFKEELNDTDYDFMSSLDIVGYSKDQYTELGNLTNRKNTLIKKFKGVSGNIADLDRAIEKMRIDPSDPTKLLDLSDPRLVNNPELQKLIALKNQRNHDALAIGSDLNKCQSTISGIKTENFSGTMMGSLSNSQCATTIRNCFSHGGRIFVDSKKPGGEIRLVLTDYDEDGKLSGVVQTNLDSLIKFFSHKTFYDVMNQQSELESMTEDVQERVEGGRAH